MEVPTRQINQRVNTNAISRLTNELEFEGRAFGCGIGGCTLVLVA